MSLTFDERERANRGESSNDEKILQALNRLIIGQEQIFNAMLHLTIVMMALDEQINPRRITRITISYKGQTDMENQTALPLLAPGAKLQLVALMFDKDDNPDAVPAGKVLNWGSSDSTVATIDEAGLLTISPTAKPGATYSITAGVTLDDNTNPIGTASGVVAAGEVSQTIIQPAG